MTPRDTTDRHKTIRKALGMTLTPEEKKFMRIVYHECGHALIVMLSGVRLIDIRIVKSEVFCRTDNNAIIRHQTAADPKTNLHIAVAGFVAEQLYITLPRPIAEKGSIDDYKEAYEDARLILNSDDEQAARRIVFRAEKEVRKILRTNWVALDAMTYALMRNNFSLTGDEAWEVAAKYLKGD